MTETANLVIKVNSDGAAKASSSLKTLGSSAKTAETGVNDLSSASEESTRAMTLLHASITGVVASLSIRELVNYANEWTNITNRLRLTIQAGDDLVSVQNAVLNVAQETRASLSATSELYYKLSSSAGEYINGQQDLISLIGTVNKAMAISGTSAESAKSAILQLSQGLSSGALRGDEFNSVLENAPRLAQAMATSLNMNTGELRNFAAQGGLTAKVIIQALREQSATIDEEFGKTKESISQAMGEIENSLTHAVGVFDDMTGSSTSLATVLNSLSGAVDSFTSDSDSMAQIVTVAKDATELFAVVIATKMVKSLVMGAKESRMYAGAVELYSLATKGAMVKTDKYGRVIETVTIKTRLASVATRGLSVAMDLLGGPVGVVMLAATAIYQFATSSSEAKGESKDLANEIDNLGKSYAQLNLDRINALMSKQLTVIDDAKKRVSDLTKISNNTDGALGTARKSINASKLKEANDELKKEVERLQHLKAEQAKATKVVEGSSNKPKTETKVSIQPIATKPDLSGWLSQLKKNNMNATEINDQWREDELAKVNKYQKKLTESQVTEARNSIEKTYESRAKAIEEAEANELDKKKLAAASWLEQLEKANMSASELNDQWRQDELDKLDAYKESKLLNAQDIADAKVAIDQEYKDKKTAIDAETETNSAKSSTSMLTTTSKMFSGMTSMAKSFKGEHSKIYNAMFLTEKAASVASVMLNSSKALGEAWSSAPWPYNMGAVTTTLIETGALEAGVQAVSMGRATGGQVTEGTPYIGAERGIELYEDNSGNTAFIPPADGKVIPTHQVDKALQQHQQKQQTTMKVTIINQIDPTLFSSYVSEPDGEDAIMNLLSRNKTELREFVS